jgi:hypothetical protein
MKDVYNFEREKINRTKNRQDFRYDKRANRTLKANYPTDEGSVKQEYNQPERTGYFPLIH